MSNVDELLRHTLRERVEGAPPAEPVIERVLGTPARAGRHWLPTLAAAAAVVLVVGAVWAVNWNRDAAPPAVEPGPAAPSTRQLDRPEHYALKELGYGGVSVLVPADWQLTRPRCGTTATFEVVFAVGEDTASCLGRYESGKDVVQVLRPSRPTVAPSGEYLLVDGAPALLEIFQFHVDSLGQGPKPVVQGDLWLPRQRIGVRVTAQSRSTVERLLSGVRLLDAPETAVPPLGRCTVGSIRAELDAADLRAKITDKSDILRSTCNTRPKAYSIVPKGSTVAVSLTN